MEVEEGEVEMEAELQTGKMLQNLQEAGTMEVEEAAVLGEEAEEVHRPLVGEGVDLARDNLGRDRGGSGEDREDNITVQPDRAGMRGREEDEM